MKSLIFLISIFSFQAFAHPLSGDLVQQIPENSEITILKDINILPNLPYTLIIQNQLGAPMCYIEPTFQSKNDRVLRAGKTFLFDAPKVGYMDSRSQLVVELTLKAPAYVLTVSCHRPISQGPYTIGELVQMLAGVMEITLAPPIEL